MQDKRVVFLAWVGAIAVLVAAVVLWIELFADDDKSGAYRAGQGMGSAFVALAVGVGLWFGAMALIRPARRWTWLPLVPLVAAPIMFMTGFMSFLGDLDDEKKLASDCPTSPRDAIPANALPSAGYRLGEFTPEERERARVQFEAMSRQGAVFRPVDRGGIRVGVVGVVSIDGAGDDEEFMSGVRKGITQNGFEARETPVRIGTQDALLIQARNPQRQEVGQLNIVVAPLGCNTLTLMAQQRGEAIRLAETIVGPF